ncbi:MAG: hypothetical protein A3E79_13760 [Burkholderiales bacterium RIFCSPHIGHO2_12_FULL_61_11]|nr:MAG: hypothetical protein A3E79_13760 [Burkholderiales bacterium RIFCSPHIGHO2_12_FULL_61_11]
MKSKVMKALLVAVALSGPGVAAMAAETGQAAQPMPNAPGKSDMPMHGGMMGGGMMDMMQSCQKMMGSAPMPAGSALPHLPPGNEKIEFQMHAEMMQKMGEIAARYADKIKERQ